LELTSKESVYPLKTTCRNIDISSLVFMDDSTLVSSNKQGMQALLSITEEYYTMNNTSANYSKYVLMTNATTCTDAVDFNLATSRLNDRQSIKISPLKKDESFHFLGTWFNISHSCT